MTESIPTTKVATPDAFAAVLARISALLTSSLDCDSAGFAQQLRQLTRAQRRLVSGQAIPSQLHHRAARLAHRVNASAAARQRRADRPLRLEFPTHLPVSAHVDELTALLTQHQVLIVSSETGSGKSTQLPKICLRAGRGIGGRIGHTQPRRIAARAIARRIAEETATKVGDVVGHCVRFDDGVARHTRLKVMTDGILLNEIKADPLLMQYDTLIIDEVHERTLNIDMLLGYVKQVLARRDDLKIIITSATMDIDALAQFFPGSATFKIEGRSFPVELRYRAANDLDEDDDINSAIVRAIAELDDAERGDILVFLAGEREIREAANAIGRASFANTEVLKLYARLGAAQQAKIFEPSTLRRIILATNVAETSLTVPRVRHVIDTGLARISRYSPRRKLQQLPVEKISRANADQRLGRCGREAAGICIRLYEQSDYEGRRAAIEPEILRTNLAGVILRLKAMGSTDIEKFPLAERPAESLIKDGYAVLQEIRALDHARELTPIGAQLNAYPVDPRLARVLVSAVEYDCLTEALIIVAALSIADPRERPHEAREYADRAHLEYADKRSDFLWFVNAWALAQALRNLPFKQQLRRCRRLFLSAVRMQEWVQLHDYLLERIQRAGLRLNQEPASYKAVHCALLAGFPSLVGEWQADHYVGCRNSSFAVHPSSIVHKRAVKWILAGEIVETARPYARLAARIDPQWIDSVAGHLLKRTYAAPIWDSRRGCALVTEIRRLFGLVIDANRAVELARIDRIAARQLFIDCGLIDGELGENPDFLQHNIRLIERIQELEARARRRDLCASQAALQAFYDERIPQSIVTRRALLRWLRSNSGVALYMNESDATSENLQSVPAYLFPDTLDVAGTACPITYRFEPGSADDGITVQVPAALLLRLRHEQFDRLVPGMLSEKVEGLLRSLPKAWRRQFSPAREYAMAAVEAVADQEGPLEEALAQVLTVMTGHRVEAALFDERNLPDHLRCVVELIDDDGAVVASGRDLGALKAVHRAVAEAERDKLQWRIDGRTTSGWNFSKIPPSVSTRSGANTLRGYPALMDNGAEVELIVCDHAGVAAATHRSGLARLLLLTSSRQIKQLDRKAQSGPDFVLHAALFGFRDAPANYLAEAFARRLAAAHAGVRDEPDFARLLGLFNDTLGLVVERGEKRLAELFARGANIRAALDRRSGDVPRAAREDIASQLYLLLGPVVAVAIDADNAERHDCYLAAIERRLERLTGNPGKDLQKLEQFRPLWQQFLQAPSTVEIATLHRSFEEYRVTLFAPELGAAVKISREQLADALAAATDGR